MAKTAVIEAAGTDQEIAAAHKAAIKVKPGHAHKAGAATAAANAQSHPSNVVNNRQARLATQQKRSSSRNSRIPIAGLLT